MVQAEGMVALEAARAFQRKGELFRAHDVAITALESDPSNVLLQHQVVLALARAGATKVAQERYLGFGLHRRSEEDVAALGARIEKDLALAALGNQRRALVRIAAYSYHAIFARTGGYYPAINAASLYLLSGELQQMQDLARETLAALERNRPQTADDAYWLPATRAEAQLLPGHRDKALDALRQAIAAAPDDLAARASTLRNLEFVSDELRVGRAWLDPMRPPPSLHYVGHIIAPPGRTGRFSSEQEREIAAAVDAHVARLRPSHGYGSLAADLLFAEALLRHRVPLHVVLPVERETFVAASVAPAGEDWCERFDACLASATTVTYASQETALDRAHLLAFSAGITMGLALMRAKELRTRPHQLAVWDGQPPGAPVGTAVEVAAWQCLGQPQSIIPCRGGTPLSPPLPRAVKRALPRRVAAMLSGDFVGYRSLSDVQLEAFMVHVLTKLRAALARHQPNVLQASFADGTFFLVLHSAEQAVACAFDLQDAMASVAMAIAALPPSLQMRIGGHFGPVRLEQGPSGQPTVVGSEVTRAAQVEPIAPGACIYVTAQFAAQLALSPEPIAATQYVGVSVGDGHARPMDIFLLTRRQADRSG